MRNAESRSLSCPATGQTLVSWWNARRALRTCAVSTAFTLRLRSRTAPQGLAKLPRSVRNDWRFGRLFRRFHLHVAVDLRCHVPAGRRRSCPTVRIRPYISSSTAAAAGGAAMRERPNSNGRTSKPSSPISSPVNLSSRSASSLSTHWSIGRKTSRDRSRSNCRLAATSTASPCPSTSWISSPAIHIRRVRRDGWRRSQRSRERANPMPSRLNYQHRSFQLECWNLAGADVFYSRRPSVSRSVARALRLFSTPIGAFRLSQGRAVLSRTRSEL